VWAAGLIFKCRPARDKVSKLKVISAHVLICNHKTCLKQGGKASAKALKHAIRERGLKERVMVTKVKCLDQCGRGPVLVVYSEGVWYGDVDKECAREIVTEHLEKGQAIEKRVLRDMRDREAGAKE
jgi:NADP-reducing hydrogenase subunit HndC